MENSFLENEKKEQSEGKISLCAIVKNEEAFIRAYLENALKFVDEIIIVDTGSTDKTIEIIESFNPKIKLFRTEWHDDFSRARNESLKHASGDWILILDPDERLELKDEQLLRKLVALPKNDNEARVYSFKQIHYYDEELISAVQYRDTFFENHKGIVYTRPIHEHIIAGNPDFTLSRAHIKGVDILHYGNIKKVRDNKQKQQRNLKILEKGHRENPEDIYNIYYLASNYYELEMYDEALSCIAKGLESGLKIQSIDTALLLNFYRILSSIYLENHLYDNLLELSVQVDSKFIQHPEILLNIGIAAYKKDDYELARHYFDQGLQNNNENNYPLFLIVNNFVNEKINYYRGLVYLGENKIEDAMEAFFNSALNNNPEAYQEIEKLLNTPDAVKVVEILQEKLKNNPSSPGVRTLISNYFMKREDYFKAIEVLALTNYDKGLILDIADFALKINDNKKVLGLCDCYRQKYGETLKLLKLRSQALINLENYQEARNDLVKAVEQARWDKELLEKLIKILPDTAPEDLAKYQERLEQIKNI
jgi:glycosyltransferase involved in cell wall biosynthesis